MSPLRVVGLDLSLTSTGVSDGITGYAYQTTGDAPTEARMWALMDRVEGFVTCPAGWTRTRTRADAVVIEGAAFGAKGDAVDQLAGLRWIVRTRLYSLGIPFAVVTPSALKKYTTGDGRAGKPEMVRALNTRHGIDLTVHKVKEGRYDIADAYALAAMGYDWLGQPLQVLTSLPSRPSMNFNRPVERN